MLKITQEIHKADKIYLMDLILNGPTLNTIDLHLLSQLKGQILAFEQILNIKEYLNELLEIANEEVVYEDKDNRSQDIS